MISITGLDKAEVLIALYENARVQGLGIFHASSAPLTKPEAETLLSQHEGNFDYLRGRVMKVSIDDSGELEERLYDRDNGAGSAERVISALRQSVTA